ncbi:MAG TPA: hypothetical protein VII92_14455 [Anaerolineae bacterium]
MIRIDQAVAIVECTDPDAYATGATTGDIIDMANFEQVMFVVMAGTLGSSATVDFQVYQSTASNMASPAVITGAAITQLTEAGTDSDKQAIVVVRQPDLTSGYRYIRGTLTVGTATSDAGVIALGAYPTYGPASDYDLTSVDEIVAL